MIKRISTGSSKLDNLLEGGFPVGSVISLYGKSPKMRRYTVFRFLQDSKQSPDALYINTKDPVKNILLEAENFELTISEVQFIDAVHWRNKRINPKLQSLASYEVSNLNDLNALLAKIMEVSKDRSVKKIILDSPTSLLLYSTPGKEQVFKFLELLNAFVRTNEMIFCLTLEDGIHTDDIINTVHYLSDGVIEFGIKEDGDQDFKEFLKIQKMVLTDFSGKVLYFSDLKS